MSIGTSRLSLLKPAVTDSMNTGDIDLNAIYSKIDTAMGAQVVTTDAAVLVGPFQGQIDWATTPQEFHCYTGTKWGFLAKDTEAQGYENSNDSATQIDCLAGAETKIIQATCPGLVSARRYAILASFFKQCNGSTGTVTFRYRVAAGTTVGTGDTLIEEFGVHGLNHASGLGQQVSLFEEYVPGLTGQVTFGLFCDNGLANTVIVSGGAADRTQLHVFEWGTGG